MHCDFDLFATECREFLEQAIREKRWHIWVAELNGIIASHVYIQLIDKVPRPGRVTYPFAYMTNVFTDTDYRAQGLGLAASCCKQLESRAKANKYEFIIVWPSEEAREFYSRNGYVLCNDPMELQL